VVLVDDSGVAASQFYAPTSWCFAPHLLFRFVQFLQAVSAPLSQGKGSGERLTPWSKLASSVARWAAHGPRATTNTRQRQATLSPSPVLPPSCLVFALCVVPVATVPSLRTTRLNAAASPLLLESLLVASSSRIYGRLPHVLAAWSQSKL